MSHALKYIIEVIVCSGLFLVAYRWLLAKKVSFGHCRAFIMTSMLLAVGIPVMNVPLFPEKTFEQQKNLIGFDFIEEELDGTAAYPAVETQVQEAVANETASHSVGFDIKAATGIAARLIYIIVTLASLGLTVYNIIKIQRLRRRSKLTHTEEYTLAEHEDIKTPFSFIRTGPYSWASTMSIRNVDRSSLMKQVTYDIDIHTSDFSCRYSVLSSGSIRSSGWQRRTWKKFRSGKLTRMCWMKAGI